MEPWFNTKASSSVWVSFSVLLFLNHLLRDWSLIYTLARKKYYLEGHGMVYLSVQADSPHLNSLWEHLAPYGVFPLFSEQKKVVIIYWSLVCSPGKCQSFFTPYNLMSSSIFFPEFSCWFLRVKWQSIWHMQYWHRSFTQLIENVSLYQQFFMVQGQDVSFQKRIRRWL